MAKTIKFRSSKALREAVDTYFASISRTVNAMDRSDTGEKDAEKRKIYETTPIYNDEGEPIRVREYIVPPTVGGLCEFLDITRPTWSNYCDGTKNPEFLEVTTRARGRIQAYLEAALLTSSKVQGIIFQLQNSFGYSDKREVELGPTAARTVTAAGMPMAEKLALLQEMAEKFRGAGEDDEGDGD